VDIGPPELIIVLVIVLLLFGGKKLPELARSLGQAKREFNEGTNKDDAKSKDAAKDTPTKATASAEPIVEVPAPQVEADSSPSKPSGGSTTT
jgi:sec-independent protein translocase protein TatA